jgi:hypothetical protein
MNHLWYDPENNQDAPIVWSINSYQSGWAAEQRGDRWAVCYQTNEVMRLGADGALSIGQSEPYWFTTREWAELCAARLNSLDTAFGRGPDTMFLNSAGCLGIGTSSPAFRFEIRNGQGWEAQTLVAIDQQGVVKRFNLPALAMIWWRSTTAYRVWRVLMWGEKA